MRLAATLAALLFCACATTDLPVAEKKVDVPLGGTRVATFEYLGAGGWLIRRGNDAVMTAPFFTNTHYLFVLRAGALNKNAIARHIGMIDGGVADVRAVLAGHAHYDHIMDLPEVAKHLPRAAMVLGGDTVCNSLGRHFWRPCIPVTDHAGTRYHEPRGYQVAK
ncbi:MAG TPA: MBL fold metallo-hydrolase, partial [Thermoanaerobaculia bacterium]|nr:MBL fold metallo-hydrolase [Thermoanaerobaculia bacterium]